MEIILYYAPTTCALVPYVALTEARADFEVRRINMRKRDHMSADYLRINPKHKVPVLIVDGQPLSDNVAIQNWIARTFPAAKLMPGDPWQELKAISMLSWCSSGIHPHLARINSPPKFCDFSGSEESLRKLAAEQVFENFRIADAMLEGREYFFEHFTAVDAHFFWCFRRASQFELDLSEFKNCLAHFDRMTGRASVQKVFAFEKEVLADFAKAA
jgi:glutathione S-transferase